VRRSSARKSLACKNIVDYRLVIFDSLLIAVIDDWRLKASRPMTSSTAIERSTINTHQRSTIKDHESSMD
jgi:hypothetical protein